MSEQNQYFPQSRPYPGVTLKEKLEEMGMGPKEFAIRTGKPEKTITAILTGASSITSDMAIQFEKVTRIPARFWMNSQRNYDEFVAREKYNATISAATDWARSFPTAAMVNYGWIEKNSSIEEKTAELLTFFGFANHRAWEEYYFNQQLKVTFRISLASTRAPYSIAAWLRKGELQASEIRSNTFSAKAFKNIMPQIKSLMASDPTDVFAQLQSLCANAGVKVVHTPCLPKAPINGATRWINETPLIQLTGRYKRNDIFWFTFFHEAGHILLHGKKQIFLEQVDYSDKDVEKEHEADQFAANWTLTAQQEQEIIEAMPVKEETIRHFSRKFGTHPAIIVGRLQHRKLIHPSQGRQFFGKVEFD